MLSNIVLEDFDNEIGLYAIEQKIRYTRYADDMTFSGDFNAGKVISKVKTEKEEEEDVAQESKSANDGFEISDIYEEENSDGIIDKLFHTNPSNIEEEKLEQGLLHKVDPEEFVLYKKYL